MTNHSYLPLVFGLLIIAFNTALCLVFDGYGIEKGMLCNGAILSISILLWLVAASSMADGFKIGLGSFFGLTGIFKIAAVVALSLTWGLLIFFGIILLEAALCILGLTMSKH